MSLNKFVPMCAAMFLGWYARSDGHITASAVFLAAGLIILAMPTRRAA